MTTQKQEFSAEDAAPSVLYGKTDRDSKFAFPVAIDSDGKIQVAGTFSGGGDGAIVDGTNSTIRATVLDLTNSNPITVAITDANGDQVSSFGGGTQYTEDNPAAANPIGGAVIVVRDDALAGGITTTDGDNIALRGNNKGELYIKHTDSINVTASVINIVSITGSTTLHNLPLPIVLSDSLVNPTTSSIASLLYGYIQATGDWDRCRMAGDNSDALGTAGTGHLQILSHLMTYDSAGVWNRARGDISNGLDVDVTRVSGTVNITGSTTIAGIVSVTGSTSVSNVVNITGSTTLVGVSAITGNTTILGTVAITGSTTLAGVSAITGNTTILGTVNVTGSTVVVGTASITGNTSVINTVTVTGTTVNIFERVSTSNLTNVSASTASTQLLASTAGRKQAIFYNDSTATLYLKFGTTASTSSFTVKLFPDDYYELSLPIYTGVIHGVWSATNGAVRVTENT